MLLDYRSRWYACVLCSITNKCYILIKILSIERILICIRWNIRYEANISNLTVNEILHEIRKVGDLYDSPFTTAGDYTQIIQLMSKFYGNNYDITDVMERVSSSNYTYIYVCSVVIRNSFIIS